MYRLGPGFHHGPGVFGWLFMAVLLALLVVAVMAVVRAWRHPQGFGGPWRGGPPPRQHGPPMDPALFELRMRYARGDIAAEEYWRRAADLGYPQPGGVPPSAGPAPGAGAPPV
jgi:uncharacterized membrane protein